MTLSDTHTLVTTTRVEGSARHMAVYLHNTQQSQISVPPARLEPAIPESEGPQTHTLDHTATATGVFAYYIVILLN